MIELAEFLKARGYKPRLDAGRRDLIGSGPKCLIPEKPPREALEARRRAATNDAKNLLRGSRNRPRS